MWDDEELLKILFAFISFSNELLSHLVSKAGKTEPYKTSEKSKKSRMVFCYQNYSVKKNCPSDREKLLKFEVEGWEFVKFERSLEQFIQTVKGQNNFW